MNSQSQKELLPWIWPDWLMLNSSKKPEALEKESTTNYLKGHQRGKRGNDIVLERAPKGQEGSKRTNANGFA